VKKYDVKQKCVIQCQQKSISEATAPFLAAKSATTHFIITGVRITAAFDIAKMLVKMKTESIEML
jgi:hypothetical protein